MTQGSFFGYRLFTYALPFFSLVAPACAAPDASPSAAIIAGYKGLCRLYTVPLGPAYLSAVQDAYSAVLTSRLAAIGTPDVLFAAPIGPDTNPAEVKSWSICIPVTVPEGSEASDPYTINDVPQANAIQTTCGPSSDDRQTCANLISGYLTQHDLNVTRMSQLTAHPDGSATITVAVKGSN